MKIISIKKCGSLEAKKVFLRADFNVPLKKGLVKDDFKIVSTLPTIRYLQRYKAKIIIASHLGKPKGEFDKKYSLGPVADRLSKLLGQRVDFNSGPLDIHTGSRIGKMKPGDILLLDNLRFSGGEEKNSRKFARELSSLADIYVNDAFGVSHRKHASVSSIKDFLPSYAGLLLEKELENLNKILKPEKPLIVVMGGSKMGTKMPLVKKLYSKSHRLLLGGALANNFLLARGYDVGKSLIDKDSLNFAKNYKGKKIILPIDFMVKNIKTGKIESRKADEIGKQEAIFDIGPETIKLYAGFIKKAATIIWNGPLGMFESPRFRTGTVSVAQLIASRSGEKTFSVIGGGETVEAAQKTKMQDHISWISTGGGAMLSYLGGEDMPGLKKIIKTK